MLKSGFLQAKQHEWLVTKGGTQPVQLTEVGKHAENLARQRKQFKQMANAIIAVNRMGGVSMSVRVCTCDCYTPSTYVDSDPTHDTSFMHERTEYSAELESHVLFAER